MKKRRSTGASVQRLMGGGKKSQRKQRAGGGGGGESKQSKGGQSPSAEDGGSTLWPMIKHLLVVVLAVGLYYAPSLASSGEAAVDGLGNVAVDGGGTVESKAAAEGKAAAVDDAEVAAVDPTVPLDEQLVITITNESPYRVDVYFDDGSYGVHISILEQGGSTSINSYIGHKFFVTRHGVKEGLFAHGGTEDERRLRFDVGRRDQKFVVPDHARPSDNPCLDRFGICKQQADAGMCERSPGWMIVHCCESCDPYLNSSELIDPAKRCSKEQLKTPDPVWRPGDLNKLFESWAQDAYFRNELGFQVVSSPDPATHGATWEGAEEGSPWVVVFDNFLTDEEVADLVKGGELEGYERSTDQGAANAYGEQEKVVSTTRTSSNAWCMHKCERLPGVRSASKKIEAVTGIPQVNYESFQLLKYDGGQFYRSHHDSSSVDDSPAGHRILTFFLYLSDVEEGGETYFSKLGIAVKPKKGRALVWPSVLDEDPTYWDKRMYHEAKDVIKGEKKAANHWIHLNDYRTPNEWGCTGSFS